MNVALVPTTFRMGRNELFLRVSELLLFLCVAELSAIKLLDAQQTWVGDHALKSTTHA